MVPVHTLSPIVHPRLCHNIALLGGAPESFTTLQKASVPMSRGPWPHAARVPTSQGGWSSSWGGHSAVGWMGVRGSPPSCWRREMNQEGLTLLALTWMLSQHLGIKFSWEWKLFPLQLSL